MHFGVLGMILTGILDLTHYVIALPPQTCGMLMVLMEPGLWSQVCAFPAPILKCAGFCGDRPAWQKAILYVM